MARRVVDMSLLQGLVQGSQNQEVNKGTPRTTDPNFPVFTTPINQDIIVYFPMVNVVTTENGTDMQVLKSHIHEARVGKSFTSVRCISGLAGGVFDQLGYDGSCPACDAMQEVWELYRVKLNAEAKRLGIDPQNDPQDVLKPAREKILSEMDLKNAEEYVTFPVVIIPTAGKFQPAPDAMEKMQAVFVHWRRKRYNDAILSALDSLMVNPGHPGGMFWLWKFSYDTKGKQANARDSAKNAKYTPITDQSALALFEPFREAAEEKAKEFTLVKAAEVVVANQFLYKEDLEAEVNKIMARTRNMLELAKMGGMQQPALGAGQPAGQLGFANPLANFGIAQEQPQAQPALGAGQPQFASQSQLGAGQPANQQQQPNMGVSGSPIQFG